MRARNSIFRRRLRRSAGSRIEASDVVEPVIGPAFAIPGLGWLPGVGNFTRTQRTFSVAFAIARRIAAKVLHQMPDGEDADECACREPYRCRVTELETSEFLLPHCGAPLPVQQVVCVSQRIARMRA